MFYVYICAILWVLTDLSISTYMDLSRTDAPYLSIFALSRRVQFHRWGEWKYGLHVLTSAKKKCSKKIHGLEGKSFEHHSLTHDLLTTINLSRKSFLGGKSYKSNFIVRSIERYFLIGAISNLNAWTILLSQRAESIDNSFSWGISVQLYFGPVTNSF